MITHLDNLGWLLRFKLRAKLRFLFRKAHLKYFISGYNLSR